MESILEACSKRITALLSLIQSIVDRFKSMSEDQTVRIGSSGAKE